MRSVYAALALVFFTTQSPDIRARRRPRWSAALPPAPVNATMSAAELSTSLDGYLSGVARSGDFAGVVLVAKDGTAVFEKAYDVADREHGTPMSPERRACRTSGTSRSTCSRRRG